MDVPESRPQGAEGGVSAPRVDPPVPLHEPVATTARSGAFARRPSRIKGGPIAAFVATALVLGVTAIPAGAPTAYRDGPSSAAPRSTQVAGPVVDLPQLATVDLGAAYGEFLLASDAIWTDRADGTAAVTVSLRSKVIPNGFFTGKFVLRRPESVRTLDRDVVVADEDALTGFDSLRDVPDDQRAESEATAYLALVGELEGEGALAGTQLVVRNAPGGVVRRGPWRLDDDSAFVETVFARLYWMRSATGPGSVDPERPVEGAGSLALQLAPPSAERKRVQ